MHYCLKLWKGPISAVVRHNERFSVIRSRIHRKFFHRILEWIRAVKFQLRSDRISSRRHFTRSLLCSDIIFVRFICKNKGCLFCIQKSIQFVVSTAKSCIIFGYQLISHHNSPWLITLSSILCTVRHACFQICNLRTQNFPAGHIKCPIAGNYVLKITSIKHESLRRQVLPWVSLCCIYKVIHSFSCLSFGSPLSPVSQFLLVYTLRSLFRFLFRPD